MHVTCGAPQGSILRPELWNHFFDQILKISRIGGVEIIGYADDLAIIISAKNLETLVATAEYVLQSIISELRALDLEIAADKTEVVLLVSRKKDRNFSITVDGTSIYPAESIKYLDVWLDRDLNMKTHIRRTLITLPKLCPTKMDLLARPEEYKIKIYPF